MQRAGDAGGSWALLVRAAVAEFSSREEKWVKCSYFPKVAFHDNKICKGCLDLL